MSGIYEDIISIASSQIFCSINKQKIIYISQVSIALDEVVEDFE